MVALAVGAFKHRILDQSKKGLLKISLILFYKMAKAIINHAISRTDED